jgi:hypothetical protein
LWNKEEAMSRFFVAAMGVFCLLVILTTSAYADTATLAIRSQYGTPSPAVGTWTYTTGEEITASVETPVYGSPGIRYVCTGWRARGSPDALPPEGTVNSVTFTITMNTTITWRWKTQYHLSLLVSPEIYELIIAGIIEVCPASPDGYYDAKSVIILTAIANEGWDFSYWSGGLRGTTNPQELLLRGPRTVTANFILEKRYFTVSGYRPPPLDPPEEPYEYYYGDTVTVDCGTTPYSLSEGMQEVCTGHLGTGDVTDGSETSISFIIHHDSSVTWLWKTQYKLTTAANPPDQGTVTPSGETWHDEGAVVTVTATGNPPNGFINWSGDLSGTVNPTTITMDDAKSVTANFSAPTLTVSNPSGYDTPDPAAGTYTYDAGIEVTCSITSPVTAPPVTTFAEGFESGNINGWTTGGSMPEPNWFATDSEKHSGTYSARSGDAWAADLGSSWIERTFTIGAGGGTVTFWGKVDTQWPGWGWLDFYVDGVMQPLRTTDHGVWEQRTISLSPGTRTFRWSFLKLPDDYDNDCAWIDDITITQNPKTRYLCTGYTGTGNCPSGTENSVTFTITQVSSITWNWVTQHQLLTVVSPSGKGTINASPTSADGYYDSGTVVTLTAVPAAAYIFENWSGDLSGTTNPQSITIDSVKRVTANFVRPNLRVYNPSGYDTPNPAVGTYTYDRGTSITCSVTSPAIAGNERYTCTGYTGTGNCPSGSESSVTFTLNTHSTITWNWTPQYKLATAVNPSGWGTLTKSPDLEWYDPGTVVTVTATPSSGNRIFFNWSGDLTGSENAVNVTMNTGKSVTANFGATLTVTSPYGEPNPPVGVNTYLGGTPIRVSCGPTPYAGPTGIRYVCTGWTGGSGDIPGAGTGTSYGPFSINANCAITWTWQTQYYLSVSVTPTFPVAGGTVAPVSAWYDPGTSVEETATANTGFTFSNWSGDASGTNNSVTVTMDAPKTIAANFNMDVPRVVTVTSAQGEPIPPVGATSCPNGSTVPLSCGPDPYPVSATGTRYTCTGWTGGSGNIPSTGTAPSYSFTITVNSTITWTWKTQYQMTTEVNPAGEGSISLAPLPEAGGWYDSGTVVSCTAAPNEGWGFANWSGDLSGTANPQDLTMNAPKSITANFIMPTLTVSNPTGYDNPVPPVGTYTYNNGTSVTCSVTSPTGEIEPLEDGFESGTLDEWTTGGKANWFITDTEKHSGTYSARSGALANNRSTYIERTFNIGEGGGKVTFWWKVSSEGPPYTSNPCDFLEFYIDGELQPGSIAGEVDWEEKTFSLAAGARTLRWRYAKDTAAVSGSDCGWIDDITIRNPAGTPYGINYACTGFIGTGSCPSGTESSVRFTITSHSSITWTWKIVYKLFVNIVPPNGGTVDLSPPGINAYYDPDTTVTLTATANSGYLFGFWSGDLTGNTNPQSLTMSGPKNVTVNFTGQNKLTNFAGVATGPTTITWSWTSDNADWQSTAAGVLRTMATTLATFQSTYLDLPPDETCPRDGTGNDRLLFEASDDLPGGDPQDCPTVDASTADTYTITYTRLSSTSWTCIADTYLTILKDFYIDETRVLREEMSTGNGPQANSGSSVSPDNVWFEVQDSIDTAMGTVYPNLTSWQETGLLENEQYTRHVHAVNAGVYSAASDDVSRYTLVHDATTSDFTVATGISAVTRTIGTGTEAKRYPMDAAYCYARCQFLLYGAAVAAYQPNVPLGTDELGQNFIPGKIVKIRFQRAAGDWDEDYLYTVEMHMAHTTAKDLMGGWVDTSTHQLVLSGDLSVPYGGAGTWYEIGFVTPPSGCTGYPFYFDGSSNLIISFRHQSGLKEDITTTWRTELRQSGAMNYCGRCVALKSDTNNPPDGDVAADHEETGEYGSECPYGRARIPNVQIDFEIGGVTITVTTLPAHSTAGLTGVRIERAEESSFTTGLTVVQPFPTEPGSAVYTKTELPPTPVPPASINYWYRIRFQNAEAVPSAYSEGRMATVPMP